MDLSLYADGGPGHNYPLPKPKPPIDLALYADGGSGHNYPMSKPNPSKGDKKK